MEKIQDGDVKLRDILAIVKKIIFSQVKTNFKGNFI